MRRHTKPSILQFVATYGGGIATHVARLASRLNRDKYEVRVLCPTEGELRRRLDRLALPVDCLPMATEVDVLGDARLIGALMSYLRRNRFDLVHTHSTKAGLLGRLAARLQGVPIVLHTPHAYRFLRFPTGSLRWGVYVAAEWIAGRLGTGTLAVGPSEGEIGRALHLARQTFVVNNGVPILPAADLRRDPTVRSRLGLPPGSPLVVTVGRLMRQKAPLTFVEAAARVAREHATAAFVMVGDGELEPMVRRRAQELGVAGRLHLVPRTDEVAALLLETDVFVMTSRYEGLSYAAAEAAALGRALVVSDVPGLRDVVQHERTGLLVQPDDVVGFAEGIRRTLCDSHFRAAMGAAAARYAAQHFAEDRMIRETEALYDRLLERRGDR